MIAIKQPWLRRSLAFLLIVAMILSMGVVSAFAQALQPEANDSVFVTEITEKTAKLTVMDTGNITGEKSVVYQVQEKSEPAPEDAAAFQNITDKWEGNAATAELTALTPGTEYIVYTAIAYTVDGTPAYTEIAATGFVTAPAVEPASETNAKATNANNLPEPNSGKKAEETPEPSTPAANVLTDNGNQVSITAGKETTEYETFAAAVTALNQNIEDVPTTLTLLENLTIDENIEIKGGTQTTLDLNGNTVTLSGNITLSSGKLLLTDSNTDNPGKLTITGSHNFDVTASEGSAELAIQNCVIEARQTAVKTTGENASLKIENGADVSATERSAVVIVENGYFEMTGGQLIGNSGPALTDSSNANGLISGGSLTGNANGASAVSLRGSWTISDGTFILQNGGPACVSVETGGTVNITGGAFDASQSMMGMYGIVATSGTATISGGRYKWNSMYDSMGAGYAMGAILADGKALSEEKDSDGYYTIVDTASDLPEGTGTLSLTYTLNNEQKEESFDNPNAMRRALQELDESAEKVIVRLDSNVTTAEAWNINRDITLDLNGHTYTSTNMLYAIEVESGISFVLDDSSDSHTGILTGTAGIRAKTEDGKNSIVINGGEVKGGAGDSTAILVQKGNSITINGGKISGSIAAYGSTLEVLGGHIEHSRNQPVVNVQDGGGSFVMTGGEIVNSYERTAGVSSFSPAVSIDGADANTAVSISDGSIQCREGSALQIRTSGRGDAGTFNIGGNARIESSNGIAITYTYAITLQTGNGSILKIGGNAVISGGTHAIYTEKPQVGNLYVQIDGGYFGYDAENLIPFADDSSYVVYPEGRVLDIQPVTEGTYAGYYTLADTDDLIWTEGNEGQIVHQYQEFEDLDRLLNASEPIYETGNDNYQSYAQEVWDPFVVAYEAAENVKNNKNANQNEINFFLEKLATAKKNLDESLESEFDVYNLADGTYEIDVYMWKTLTGDLSMADSTIDRTAVLTVKDGKASITLQFHPMYASLTWGALEKLWVYNGDTFEETRTNALTHSGESAYMTDASYDDYYTYNATTGEITANGTGTNPGTVTIPIRYTGDKGNDNKVYCRVSVDAMNSLGVGEQNVILSLQYSTLKAVDVQPTLSLSDYDFSLIAGENKTVTATLKGANGYAVTRWESSNPSVATVDNNGKITAVAQGTATITVTATKAGAEPLTKTISVTVAPAGSEAVEVESIKTSGNTETVTLSGNFLTSGGADGVTVNGNTVTIHAKSSAAGITSSKVVIPQETAKALAEMTVIVEANTGSITLDSTLVGKIASAGSDVTLTLAKASVPSSALGSFHTAYNFNITNAKGNAITFGSGKATLTVASADAAHAYLIEGSTRAERMPVSMNNGTAIFTAIRSGLWALSANEYEIGGAGETPDQKPDQPGTNPGGGTTENGFFLEDGNYYVNISLYKADSNEVSMGNVAFKNNNRAIVTVKNGKVTRVQISTNPVTIDPYYSAITKFSIADGTRVNIEATGSLTTKPAGKNYTYIKTVSFNLPNSAQPDIRSSITYVPVNFYVPDTPMDAAVGEVLSARLRFAWSTATPTERQTIGSNDTAAAGTSSITGEEIVDEKLEDEKTGIVLETNTGVLSDEAELSVTEITSGEDFELAETALNGVMENWKLYKIVALVDGVETDPQGAVTLRIPCDNANAVLYRINADGTKTLLKGSLEDGYYVFSTTKLGLFALGNEAAEGTAQQNANADNGEAAFAEGGVSEGAPSGGNNTLLWIILGVVVVAAAAGLTVYFVRRKRKGV